MKTTNQLTFKLQVGYTISLLNVACSTNSNFIVFGLTQLGHEPMIYCPRVEHANHYTTDAVFSTIDTSRNKLKNRIIGIICFFNDLTFPLNCI